ncbi:hypothetical protein I4U23_022324 [Adineta vaga]|nr:hypothetical protein I4U23_022324 [Adineta vaga]
MSVSINYDLILTLASIQKNLFQYGGPILVILGTIGNLLSCAVFAQKTLRKNPCSIYFLAFNIASIIVIYGGLFPPVLELGFNIDYSILNLDLCRLRLYVSVTFSCLCPSYLILASIDRVFITSSKAHMRRHSSVQTTIILIIIITLFWFVCSIPIAIFSTILPLGSDSYICFTQTNTYTNILSFGVFAKEILVPALMIIFGIWAIKNVHRMKNNTVVPTAFSVQTKQIRNGAPSVQAKDRQLVLILLINIIIYVPFSSVLPVLLLYNQFTQYNSKSIETVYTEYFVFRVATYCIYVPYCLTSYAQLLMSKTFRKELKNVILHGRFF